MKSAQVQISSIVFCILFWAVSCLAHDNVVVIPLGGKAIGNAEADDVVKGKTFSNASEKGVTGTRPIVPIAKTGTTRSDHSGDDASRALYYGESVSPRFYTGAIILGSGRLDNLTGLIWQTAPSSTSRTWVQAIDHCDDLVTGTIFFTFDDWRLPNINELISIIDRGEINPALPAGVFTLPNNGNFWTSTPYAVGDPSLIAWTVHMGNGAVETKDKDLSYPAMCVRGQFKPLIIVPLSSDEKQE